MNGVLMRPKTAGTNLFAVAGPFLQPADKAQDRLIETGFSMF
jgi:hypothetical protein